MSVRINLEIGHEASVRTKRTPEGFTHDWEVFVRGCEGAEIHYFIDKVVFHLHETFPKPKRVIKEPPYAVKESGYAGFNLPIEVYLRNKDEPKKIKFNYDLHLQPSGPAIMNVQKEKHIFNLPNDEFKNKLLRGGGIIVNSSAQESTESTNRVSLDSKNELTSKPKLGGGDPIRKNRNKEESRVPDSFHSLFGTPITKTSKGFPDLKTASKDVNKNTNTSSNNTKPEKDKNKEKSKYSPNKDKDKERERDKSKDKQEPDRKKEKEEKKNKEKNRERDHSKEKSSKREKSPRPRSISPKRSPKRLSSPKRPPSPPPIKHKEKDDKRIESNNKDKEKKDKVLEDKSDKKSKKDKRDKEKDHKENKHKEKESQRSNDYKDHKSKEPKPLLKETTKDKEASPLPPPKVDRKEKPKEIIKEEAKVIKEPDTPALAVAEKVEKSKSDKSEEKQKHKHKKKDKDRKDRDKEKSHREKSKDKEKPVITKPEPVKEVRDEKNNSLFSSPKNEEKQKKPISLFSEVEVDSSNSSVSSREESSLEPVEKTESKKESIFEPKKPKIETDKSKKEKNKKNKDKKAEKEEKKRKRKSEKADDEPPEKIPKEDVAAKDSTSDSEQNSNTSRTNDVDKENQENPEDYMQILRDLQSKIMNLQDNSELQKVVQLIAETGRYEVSQRTFDFDLCLLEKSTVRQLQEFFASSS